MKKGLVFLFAALAGTNLMAATLHVDLNSTNPTAPYATRETAATNIQTAVTAAAAGDTVQVWDGHYLLATEISVSKAITVQSANGPETTVVDGQGTVRCFNLGNSACVVEGLMITNGFSTGYGGGIYCSGAIPVVTNCTISGNTASNGGGVYGGTANHCTLSGNSAGGSGGGMSFCAAYNCTLSGNSANYGGGMYGGTANHCALSGNSAASNGGGLYNGTANHCIISGNSAGGSGGGMGGGTANNCTLSGNWVGNDGGGVYLGTANNCIISGNSALNSGGGMYKGTANNCTLSGNSGKDGGGMYGGTAKNSIIYYNDAVDGNDLRNTAAFYSCSPDGMHGVSGNITNAPLLVSSSHIAADSPCRGAGSAEYTSGTDIDGEAWGNPPSMGCDEPSGNLPGGNLSVAIVNRGSRAPSGYVMEFIGVVAGNASMHVWDFGGGSRVTNQLVAAHTWNDPGSYDVVLTAYNEEWPNGVSATQEVSIVSLEDYVIHVSPNGNDANDGTSREKAKATIQAGIDAQIYTNGLVLVDGGFYPLSATITVSKPVRIVGTNGPESTVVDGQGIVRCFYLGNIACVVEGMTITNGYSSEYYGGGIYCSGTTPVVTHCIISGNTASNGGGMSGGTANHCIISGNSADREGGGIYLGTANNCILSGNSAGGSGGGMVHSTANNCTLSRNSSKDGGGMYGGTANNCTLSGNSASSSGGGMCEGTAKNSIIYYNSSVDGNDLRNTAASYSCSPDGMHGVNGNITNAPILVSTSHIAVDSPCRGAGSTNFTFGTDIDGEAWADSPSMGCDEPSYSPSGGILVGIDAPLKRQIAGFVFRFMGDIGGEVSMHVWNFGDGTRVTNSVFAEHAWSAKGTYDVVLTAYNTDCPDGVSATQQIDIVSIEDLAIYVWPEGNDANDGTSWETAKATIQAGVDAQNVVDGWVMVGAGTYPLSSTISVSKRVRIIGAEGPESTIVDGQGTVQCFNLGNSACVVEGMTITNGYSSGNGGGIYCSDTTPVVTHCILSGNSASSDGGGMSGGTANNCTISENSASDSGGGMNNGTANNCILSGNSADYGGGMYYSTANNCTLSGNSATYTGGGMADGTANNCTISGNTATYGGGMAAGTANNSIIYYNNAVDGNDLRNTAASYSCSPDGMHGVNGNITNAPMLVSSSHIALDSPCRGAGSTNFVSGTDIDGDAWANPPSMGCDEPSGNLPTGDLSVGILNEYTHAVSGYAVRFLGRFEGNASMHVWDFGDGSRVTNTLSVEHDWNSPGSYEVVLTAYNADWPDGVSATQVVEVVDAGECDIHVSPDGDDSNSGLGWEMAKATIQAGVDAQYFVGGLIWVDGGAYALTNEIVVDKPVRIIGVDGPESTVVNGQGSVRCFNLGNSACILEGLTITNGYCKGDGGGIYCSSTTPVVTNCILSGNSAYYGGGMVNGTANNCTLSGNSASKYGGGMYYGTANNCTISGNSAFQYGGGIVYGTANNCTITWNSAGSGGGGMYRGTANNSIIYYNNAVNGNDLWNAAATYSCSPKIVHGVNGNITNAPILVSSLHIAMDSPCRGAGSADYATGTDIDGEAWANPPSMGCDEPSDSPSGSILVGIDVPSTRQIEGFVFRFTGEIDGEVSMHVWNFGDGTRVTNSIIVKHAWGAAGKYDVVLTAYNTDWPNGVSATQEVSIVSLGYYYAIYVSPNGNDANDGTSWAKAKATIQAGVNAQNRIDGWVMVGAGTYSLSSTISVSKPVRIIGADGPESTLVDGQGAVSCFNLGNSACILEGLTITNGYSSGNGGGIYCSGILPVVTNCILSGNSAYNGGGMYKGTANHCTISGNTATYDGGGIYYGTANNCTISGNTATYDGGGIYYGTANNCTITWNSASSSGGGMYSGTANNSIIYYNTAAEGNDLRNTEAFYSCSPDVTHGFNGNITTAPMLVSTSHIAMDSPCRGAGSTNFVSGTDIDGEAWANPPSMGCDEPSDRILRGELSVGMVSEDNSVVSGYAVRFHGKVEGNASMHVWDFGDGSRATNSLFVEHAWKTPGSYEVILTAYNADWPDGVSATQVVEIVDADVWAIHVSPDGDDADDGLGWETAKATIQAGVDAQVFVGGLIWVDGGTYALTNEIVVDKPVRIIGVDGPESTVVNGQGSVRCFNLGNSACVVEGLTITNGYNLTTNEYYISGDGGGIYCSGILPVVTNCILSGNSAMRGGGMYQGTANDCTISGNTASSSGGGMYSGTANDCTISGNTASSYGGGMYSGTANDCTISGNTVSNHGGGMYSGTANHCTISGNSATRGGGMLLGTANNSIIYYNTASEGNDLLATEAFYSCSPDVTHGADGNITNAPVLVSTSHIAMDSPCRSAGTNSVSGTDIDGEAWANPPSMGCDEPSGSILRGDLSVGMVNRGSLAGSGCVVQLIGVVTGNASMHVWDFGGGGRVTNQLVVAHTWNDPGSYNVVLTAYNADWPDGVSATQLVHIVDEVEWAIHVSPDGDDANDGLGWETAKATIQSGVQECYAGGRVLVGSGTYALTDEIVVDKAIRIIGVDGPESTVVNGQGSVRCFNLGNSACVVEGMTITNGYNSYDGGGIYCSGILPVVTNCILSGNSATWGGGMLYGTANNCILSGNSASYGGGMYLGTANNCTISGNTADYVGGGMSEGTANNCTITWNSARRGGGMVYGTANNCIVYYNTADEGYDLLNIAASYSCSPDVTHGETGNITNAPMIVSSSHIAVDSPCRGAGTNFVFGTDIDGEAWANPPSMGCDEPSGNLPSGNLSVTILNSGSRAPSGYVMEFIGVVVGNASMYVWDFGDGSWVTNQFMAEHDWNVLGSYDVILTAYNTDWPDGVSATQQIVIASMEDLVIYVSPEGNDANDGTSWETAKATIQAGVDAQNIVDGWVMVGAGTYSLSSTISVSKPVRIIGADGPDATLVDGQGAVRCFHLGSSACVVEGMSIRNGYSSGNGGGIYCSDTNPVVTRCILSGNSANGSGGGMYQGTANYCTISGNSSGESGGGMYQGTANHCTLSGNSATDYGGGMEGGTANHCIISGNSAYYGGGLYYGTANNCTITWNSAVRYGGGMEGGTANHCIISGNSAVRYGGGIFYGTANNCTISWNSASSSGGGMYYGTANNCIVYYNTADEAADEGNDLLDTAASYSCSPDVTHGETGNITNAPMMVSSSHIAVDSPCRGAGSTNFVSGTDIDGEAWANPPSIGCDEPSDTTYGSILVGIDVPGTLQIAGYSSTRLVGNIKGAVSMHVWSFGDGTRVTNSVVVEHTWGAAGTYDVILTAYNTDWPDGVSSTQHVDIVSREDISIFVSPDGNDANDGTSWETAKATIQAGVDAQNIFDGWVMVGAGTYPLSSTISVSKPIRIVGADGPDATIVDGQRSVRCFNLGNSACVVEGMTITNGGYSSEDGGGIYCSDTTPVVTNCIITGNYASNDGGGMYYGTANNCILSGNSASYGGGMYDGTANNCTLSGNSASYGGGMYGGTANHCRISGNLAGSYGGGMHGGTANHCRISGNSASRSGGGVYYGTANNCILSGNSADEGGGMSRGTANNCIVWYNTAPQGNDLRSTTVYFSCSPDATHGVNGNITSAPVFVDAANGDYRLAAGSPCIDAGSNAYVSGDSDLAGNPRIVNGIVDMGAYEFQMASGTDADSDRMDDSWEQEYFGGLDRDGAGDYDADGLLDLAEYISGTDPTDASSSFTATVGSPYTGGFVVEWTSVEGRTYSLFWSPSLDTDFELLQDGIECPQNSYTDTVHSAESAGFYQIEVRLK